jgi:hypothetical protein
MKIKMSKQEARKITIIEELLVGRFTNRRSVDQVYLNELIIENRSKS